MGGPVCPTYVCCVETKQLSFCHECDEFPCLKLAPCADKARTLPHNTKVYNLMLLKRVGASRFLELSPDLWRQYFKGSKEQGGDELKV